MHLSPVATNFARIVFHEVVNVTVGSHFSGEREREDTSRLREERRRNEKGQYGFRFVGVDEYIG